jgi:hypothetical protein
MMVKDPVVLGSNRLKDNRLSISYTKAILIVLKSDTVMEIQNPGFCVY